MKYSSNLIVLLFLLVMASEACMAQRIAIKTNLLYGATATPNVAVEIPTGPKHSLSIAGGWQPWELSETKKLKHWLVQPEFRYWFCETFNGHFFGVHAIGGQFNASDIKLPFGILPTLTDYRYQGWAVGGGISYGYQWLLSRRWNVELSIGLGYIHAKYKKYKCLQCGNSIKDSHCNYLGPTKIGFSLIYSL